LVRHLLAGLESLSCLKISPAEGLDADWTDPKTGKEVDFFFEDASRLHRPGKDTALYLEAGARQVQRLRHRADGLAAGLEAAFRRFAPDVPVVVESSSAVQFLDPAAIVLVVRLPVREVKPATERVLHRVTDLLVNGSCHEDVTFSDVGKTGASGTHPTPVIDIPQSGAPGTLPAPLADADALRKEFGTLQPLYTWFADLGSGPPPVEMLTRLSGLLST